MHGLSLIQIQALPLTGSVTSTKPHHLSRRMGIEDSRCSEML